MATVRVNGKTYEGITDIGIEVPDEYYGEYDNFKAAKADPELFVAPAELIMENKQTGEKTTVRVDIENWLEVKVTGNVKNLACGRATVYGNVKKALAWTYVKCIGKVGKLIQEEEYPAEIHDITWEDCGITTIRQLARAEGHCIGKPASIRITGDIDELYVCMSGGDLPLFVTTDVIVRGNVDNLNTSNVSCVDGNIKEIISADLDTKLCLVSKPKEVININNDYVDYLDYTKHSPSCCEDGYGLMWDTAHSRIGKYTRGATVTMKGKTYEGVSSLQIGVPIQETEDRDHYSDIFENEQEAVISYADGRYADRINIGFNDVIVRVNGHICELNCVSATVFGDIQKVLCENIECTGKVSRFIALEKNTSTGDACSVLIDGAKEEFADDACGDEDIVVDVNGDLNILNLTNAFPIHYWDYNDGESKFLCNYKAGRNNIAVIHGDVGNVQCRDTLHVKGDIQGVCVVVSTAKLNGKPDCLGILGADYNRKKTGFDTWWFFETGTGEYYWR